MAETTLLKAEEREETGKSQARLIRKNGQIPCIIYGDKKEPMAASLSAIEALKLYNSGKMLSQLIDVETSNGEKFKAISKDVQLHPVKGNIIHVDLLRLGADARISVEVSVSFIAEEESPGLREGGIVSLAEGGMLDFGGKEMDLRKGGFVPIGKKEKADDVPARLSKNEFVMTADAVRAAGGGSVNKGAQRMYELMNNLEARA